MRPFGGPGNVQDSQAGSSDPAAQGSWFGGLFASDTSADAAGGGASGRAPAPSGGTGPGGPGGRQPASAPPGGGSFVPFGGEGRKLGGDE